PATLDARARVEGAAAAVPSGLKRFVGRQPMGRLGTAEEIASIALYLASDEASYATGQAFLVDGGFALWESSVDLPAELRRGLEAALAGVSPAALREASARLSDRYRGEVRDGRF